MQTKRGFWGLAAAMGLLLAAATASGDEVESRGAYSYIRMMTGEATVASRWNGNVEARRNMPISVGDEISVSQAGRVEIGLADGNALYLGGGSRASFDSLSNQQGEEGEFSAIRLTDGDAVLAAMGSREEQIPRIDTDDATVYLGEGARVRVNTDPRRGTVVIGRAGSVQVRTRTGTYTVKAGQFLIVRGDEEPETGRGTYSRDRFDIWVADRLETSDESRVASARYVDGQYASDVAALDGYGDWEYDSSYGADVWSPRVDAGWSPYSYGSWYYTPAGLTWWSNDPWGWYPFHYGNWFFARNRWCWAPAHVYSPAWVYWGYSSGYVGWCPTGIYSFYSPWRDTYYKRWGFQARTNLYFSIHGTFASRRVDFRGWNFTGTGSFGAPNARMNVVPGSRIADRLGAQVAISSRPIVVNPREGGVREAIRTYVREAPRTIERAAGPDSGRLAPVLARDRTLPAETQTALRERAVVAERGRLAGPTAAEIAPRGTVVERSRTLPPAPGGREPVAVDRWRTSERGGNTGVVSRERGTVVGGDQPKARVVPRSGGDEFWRTRGSFRGGGAGEVAPRERPVGIAPERQHDGARPDRTETRPSIAPRESWRSRPEVPPARRVIEGAVPERRAPEGRFESQPRSAEPAPSREWRTREVPRGHEFRSEPAPRERIERAPSYNPPPPRVERAPAYAPPPARVDRGPAPSAAPPPAPAPRSEVRHESPRERSAPAPRAERQRPN
jgi:hypothetical protein